MKRMTLFTTSMTLLIILSSRLGFSQLSGVYTVGTLGGEDFTSLTNSGGVFDALNSNGVSGDVEIQITSDLLAETGAIPLNPCTWGFTVSFVPATPSLKTINHSSCGDHLILLNGADFVLIDGRYNATGSDRFLKFASACSDKSPIRLEDDCERVTIRNCIIQSDNSQTSQSTGGAIHVHDDQVNGSDSLKVLFNLIEDYSAPVDLFDAIQVNAPDNSGSVLDGLEIMKNEVKNAAGKGIYFIDRSGAINNSKIERNSIYADAIVGGPGVGWAYAPIQIESGSGHLIRFNWIGGTSPSCSGSKMQLQMDPGTQLTALIRMKSELPNAAYNVLDSNVIRNIDFLGSTTNFLSVTAIRIESGNTYVGQNYGNFIGEIGVSASNSATASIVLTEQVNSTSNNFRAIYTDSNGDVHIEKNQIGGILLNNGGGQDIDSYLIYSSGSSATIQNNIIGGGSDNIVKNCDGDFRIIYSNGDDNSILIDGNSISGITANGLFDTDFFAIRVSGGNGTVQISNNLIANCSIGDLSNGPGFYGIRSENPQASILNNTIDQINVASNASGTQLYGIYVQGSGSVFSISQNSISTLKLLNPAAIQTNLIGIYSSGSSVFNYAQNYISDLQVTSSSNSSYIRGINTNSAIQNVLTNNVLLLSNGSNTNDVYIYGLYSNVSSGAESVWFNTIDIRGAMSGSRRSACIYKTGGANRNTQCNILNNKRVGGSGGHYCIYNNSTAGSLIYDFNLLHVDENTSKLVRHGSDRDFVQWQGLGFALNSISPFTSTDLVNSSTGQQTTTLGNDIANSALGINVDHISAARPDGLGPDMGAFEINTLLLPPFDLPITLSSFEGNCLGGQVQLNWTTKSEVDNDYFLIESSETGKDWEEVVKVAGSGSSSTEKKYNTVVRIEDNSSNYYRISQFDFDGSMEIFAPISVVCDSNRDCEDNFVYYDQYHSILVLEKQCLPQDERFEVFDLGGKLLSQGFFQDNQYPLKLDSGIYLIRVFVGNKSFTTKLFI